MSSMFLVANETGRWSLRTCRSGQFKLYLAYGPGFGTVAASLWLTLLH